MNTPAISTKLNLLVLNNDEARIVIDELRHSVLQRKRVQPEYAMKIQSIADKIQTVLEKTKS